MKRTAVALLLVVFVACCVLGVIFAVHFRTAKEIAVDNVTPSAQLIGTIYNADEFHKLMYQINSSGVPYQDIKDCYLIECIRSTSCGKYIVLHLDNGERGFIFLNEEQVAVYCLSVASFKSFRDFNFINPGLTTFDDIVTFDSETILSPVSCMTMTGHILTDGVLWIYYNDIENGEILEKSVVKSFRFVPNSDAEAYIQETGDILIPYILPIDKIVE